MCSVFVLRFGLGILVKDLHDASDFTHGYGHEGQGAQHHENGLNEIRPDNSGEAAKDCEKSSEDQEDEDGNVEAFDTVKANREFDKQRTGIEISLFSGRM